MACADRHPALVQYGADIMGMNPLDRETDDFVGALGLHAAIDYVTSIGLDAIHAHEAALVAQARESPGRSSSHHPDRGAWPPAVRTAPTARRSRSGHRAMIDRVSFEKTTYAPPPGRFEAGTPHIVGALGLHAAILQQFGPPPQHADPGRAIELVAGKDVEVAIQCLHVRQAGSRRGRRISSGRWGCMPRSIT
jgi:hypothetical protein